jgi:hypothetical protein
MIAFWHRLWNLLEQSLINPFTYPSWTKSSGFQL